MLKFSIPLPSSLYEQADQESQDYLPNLTKVEQVYRNILSSYVAQYYLRLNDYLVTAKDPSRAHPVNVLLADQLGLRLPGYGRVTTASLLMGQRKLEVPFISGTEAIACLAIEFDDSLAEASVLGFVLPAAAGTTISLEQLQSLSEFPAYLATINPLASRMTQLKKWWDRSFDASWTLISELATTESESSSAQARFSSVRSSTETLQSSQKPQLETAPPEDGVICRRSIEFSNDDDPLSLLFGIERFPQGSGESQKVSVTLNPAMGQGYLPAGVQIEAFDESGSRFAFACSRANSPSLAIKFQADVHDYFTIQLTHRGITLRDAYVI